MKYLITILLSSFCLSVFGQWSEQTTGTTNHLNAIHFIDENTGFSVGDNGTFLKTSDGGENWTLNMLPLSEQLRGLYFVNSSTGFVCSNSHLYKTTDGGENFADITAELYLPSAPSSPMHQIRIFFNGDIGIITALWAPIGVFAIKTNDGGANWTEFSVPTAGTGFGDISFSVVNSNTIYGVKNDQQYKTTDGGVSWTTIRTLPAYLSSADKNFQIFNVSGQGYADMGSAGFMHISNDASEMIMPATGTSFPHSFCFLNADIGYAMKGNQIMKTTDGGMDFNLIHTFTSITSDFNKWHVYFVDQSTGFVCGRNGKIYKMDGTTSVNKTAVKSLFKIFPNPANEIIQLDYENNLQVYSIQLVDIAGKLIRTFHKNEKTLNIAGLSKGFYLLNIQTKEGSLSEKIMINQ